MTQADESRRVRNVWTGQVGTVLGYGFRYEFLVVQYDDMPEPMQVGRSVLEDLSGSNEKEDLSTD